MLKPIENFVPRRSTISARTMNELVRELQRIGKTSGVNGLVISDSAGGRHLQLPTVKKDRKPIFAKITAAGPTDGLYDAVEQKFRDLSDQFEDDPFGKTWGATSGSFTQIREINDDATVPVGTFVITLLETDDAGEERRVFANPVSSNVDSTAVKESIEKDTDDKLHLVNDELVPTDDPSMYGFDSLDSPTKGFKLFEEVTFISAIRLNDTTNEIEVKSRTGFVYRPSSPGAFVGVISDPTNVLDPVTTGLVLLLHMNGPDGSPIFLDTGCLAHTVVANGSVQIDTAVKKFGNAGGLFARATSDFLKIANSQAWNVAAADFTIDFFFNSSTQPPTGGDNTYRLFSIANANTRNASNYSIDVVIVRDTPGIVSIIFNTSDGVTQFLTPGAIITSLFDGSFHHIACVRDGTTNRLFVDGVQATSVAVGGASLLFNGGLTLQIGSCFDGTSCNYTGTLDEIRMDKGTALNTGTTFPVPTSEHADCGG